MRASLPVPRHLVGRVAIAAVAALAAAPAGAQRPVGGLHLGGPVGASVAGGVLLTPRDRGIPNLVPYVLVEPGLRGGRVSAGYGLALGGLGSFATARASLLRTWRVPTPRSYVGAELQFLPLFAVGGRLGAFVPTGAGAPRRVLLMGDVSIGL